MDQEFGEMARRYSQDPECFEPKTLYIIEAKCLFCNSAIGDRLYLGRYTNKLKALKLIKDFTINLKGEWKEESGLNNMIKWVRRPEGGFKVLIQLVEYNLNNTKLSNSGCNWIRSKLNIQH